MKAGAADVRQQLVGALENVSWLLLFLLSDRDVLMTRHMLLNNIDHQDLSVLHQFADSFGDAVAVLPAFALEWTELQKTYPILLRRDEEHWQAVVLLGFAAEENLFLTSTPTQHPGANGWDARYVPLAAEKGPFLIGFQRPGGLLTTEQQKPDPRDAVIHIDVAHPKVSRDAAGLPLFLPQGGASPYLQYISGRLQQIQHSLALAPVLFQALEQLDLIEPLNIEFSLENGEKHRLTGNYSISSARLAALSGDDLQRLNQSGFLPLIYAQLSSLSNIQQLVDRKNQRLRQQQI